MDELTMRANVVYLSAPYSTGFKMIKWKETAQDFDTYDDKVFTLSIIYTE